MMEWLGCHCREKGLRRSKRNKSGGLTLITRSDFDSDRLSTLIIFITIPHLQIGVLRIFAKRLIVSKVQPPFDAAGLERPLTVNAVVRTALSSDCDQPESVSLYIILKNTN